MDVEQLEKLSKQIRHLILRSTTTAGSGHPTSSLSAVELMVGLLFGGAFRYRLEESEFINNDRLIFSKGHASPLFYALWSVAGAVSAEEMMTLRQFESRLEGHPTRRFPYTEVATGSLGQGLSVGVGMALNAKLLDKLPYRTFVLLGDSEMAEGSNWEAMQVAAHYRLSNLVGIIDVNRLGQRGETMAGWHLQDYARKAEAFGWEVIMLEDGHHFGSVRKAYEMAFEVKDKPVMIVAKTVKGKGVSFIENDEGWHGKALSEDELTKALEELGEVDMEVRGELEKPEEVGRTDDPSIVGHHSDARSTQDDWLDLDRVSSESNNNDASYELGEMVATRKAYGEALVEIGRSDERVVVLDAEVSNSTHAEAFQRQLPERFIEMFIAEQNMAGVAAGLARRGKRPIASTFAAFWMRAADQIRMNAQAALPIVYGGSHAGVSIGEDGGSQMGLEDLALFRSVLGSVVFYPGDAVATHKLTKLSLQHEGCTYIRLTRAEVPVIYDENQSFVIGGSQTLRESGEDVVTLVGAGITLHECLKAYDRLNEVGIKTRVIDLYSIKPLDVATLVKACKETKALIVVEDHYPEGGIAEAVRSGLIYETTPIHSLAVRKLPRSGKPEELLAYEEIDAAAIVERVMEVVGSR
jgi:transketolase